MDFDELRKILDLIREHELSEFELEREDLKLRVKKAGALPPPPVMAPIGAPLPIAASQVPVAGATPASAASAAAPQGEDESDIELALVKSPIVGTFYRSPEPNAKSFVEVGDTVKKGQVLCIIEAMKLMNEIDSEFDGEVVNVYVENGQPVQYGERLFAIRRQ